MVKYQIEGRGRRSRNRMVVGFTTTPMQSVPVTTNIVNSNTAQARCTRYNIM
jgi:hypothetical protein